MLPAALASAGGANGHGTIDISGNAQVKNALGKDGGAGIGSGYEGDGNVNISDNATIENAEGGQIRRWYWRRLSW